VAWAISTAIRFALELGRAGIRLTGVGETVQETGAPVRLDQHRGDRRERQQPGEFVPEFGGFGRDVFGRQRTDDQVAVGALLQTPPLPAGAEQAAGPE